MGWLKNNEGRTGILRWSSSVITWLFPGNTARPDAVPGGRAAASVLRAASLLLVTALGLRFLPLKTWALLSEPVLRFLLELLDRVRGQALSQLPRLFAGLFGHFLYLTSFKCVSFQGTLFRVIFVPKQKTGNCFPFSCPFAVPSEDVVPTVTVLRQGGLLAFPWCCHQHPPLPPFSISVACVSCRTLLCVMPCFPFWVRGAFWGSEGTRSPAQG